MIRVLEVLATLKRAGAERMAVSIARGLDRTRFEPRVLSLYDAFPGGFESELAAAGVNVSHLGKRPDFDPRMLPRLHRAFRAFQPHIVHTHSYLLRYTFPAGWLARCPAMVHTVHNVAEHETDGFGRWVGSVAYRHGVHPVAVGGEVARSFEEHYGIPPAATIPNGIDLEPFRGVAERGDWRRSHGFGETDGLIVSVARLEPQKNPLGLIEAFAAALGSLHQWHLLIAGDGTLREPAERAVAERGLEGRIHLLGVRQDTAAMLQAADLFALASSWEGTPLAVMEAMAAGLPVVATAVGGVRELVEEGRTGVLVPPGNPRALADALRSVALDPERRRCLGMAGRERAAAFGEDAMVGAYAALFEKLAGGRA